MMFSRAARPWMVALICAPALALAARPVVPAGHPAPQPAPEPTDAGAVAPAPEAPAPVPSSGPVRPVAPASATPAAPVAKPRELPAELTAKPIEAKKIENPAEVRYQQKANDHFFRLRVRPGSPKPGDALELIAEVAEIRDPPDPVLGDRVPVQNEELVGTFGKGGVERVWHPLAAAGEFGMHVEAVEAGVQTLTIHRRTDKPGIEASFPVGIGVPTPARPDDVQASADAKPLPMVAGSAPSARAGDLDDLMRQLELHTVALAAALDRPKSDTAADAKAIADLSARVAGLVPAAHGSRVHEFDAVAKSSAATAAELAHPSDREKLKAKLDQLEQGGCLRCHAQFWWGVADDTSAWPSFTPATVGAGP